MKKVFLTLMMAFAYLLAWADNSVTVTYNGNTATVTVDDNVAPYLTVTQSGAHVSIIQGSDVVDEITYTLTGTSTDGEFYMSGSYKATIELNGLTLTNTTPVYSGAAVHIQNGKRINVKVITGTTNTLTDAASGSQKGCLYVKGHAEFKQYGTLNVVGNLSHGIKAGEYISVKNATINVTSAVGDGISCNQYFLMESGSINISGTGDDGIQCDLDGDTSTGMTVNHEDEDSGNLYVSGGSITINSDAIAAKGIKCQGDAYISGTAVINVTTTGKGEWDETDQETNAACGLSADGDINISGGTLNLTATGSGGKGMKCDNVLNVSGGNTTIATTGGLYYNDGNGNENTNYTSNTDWVDNKYYSAAKGIKAGYKDESSNNTICYGGINISGGTLYVTTKGRNAEGIESKNYLNITGGETTIDAYDDGINAAQDLYITDGHLYSRSSNNDGIDANGNVVIEGGLIYAIGAGSPEVAIDANSEENKRFHFNGGILIAIGGLESGSTLAQTCYQASSVSSNTWYSMTYGGNVLAFLTPTTSSGGSGGGPGGGPGGGGPGGNSSAMVISAPSTPTLKSGVTVSNGTPVFYGPKSYLDATVTGGSNVSLSQYSSGGGGISGSYTVTATANPTEGGIVTGAGVYTAHTLCTLTATANPGYTFVNWTRNGSVASTNPTYSFYVTENTTCVANFAQGTYTVTATANPTEGGSITGTGTYSEGANVTLNAIANEGYDFLNWTENGTVVSTQASYTFVVSSNRNLVANFEEIIVEGPRLTVLTFTPEAAPVNQETGLSLTLKNVGTEPTSGITTVSLTCDDNRLTLLDGDDEVGVIPTNGTVTLQDAFSFVIAEGVEDGTPFQIDVQMVCGTETWTGMVTVTAHQAVLEYQNMVWDGSFAPSETITLTANFKNTGHYQATNAMAIMTSSSDYVMVSNSPINIDAIAAGEEVSCEFDVTIAANCPASEVITVTFTMTADGGLTAEGTETLKNSCIVTFELHDSYSGNDGWNNAKLTVSFDDGSPSQELTISNGSNSAVYPLEIGNGTHVTLTWTKGSYDNECSFIVSYEGDLIIYEMTTYSNPSAGVLYEFDCNCAAATTVFNVNVTSSNDNHGTVSGGGEFSYGESCTVTATPAEGYIFSGWTEDGEMVSGANPYTFIVTSDHNLVANFIQAIEIGENTSTNTSLPSQSYYNYTLSQQIYTAEEIGMAGTINSIAFYNGATADRTRSYDFYLKTTAKSSFSSNTDWIAVAESDKVFSGSVVMAAGSWTFVTFDTPFEYDGTSNLVLVADDNSGRYDNQPYMACSVFNTTQPQAIYIYSDGTNYNPMSPPTTSSYNNQAVSVKNHILLGITSPTVTQTIKLFEGWNWISTYIEVADPVAMLDMLKEGLGENALLIEGTEGYTEYESEEWCGDLDELGLTNEQSYLILVENDCTVELQGVVVNPADYPIIINPGWNRIGFPCSEEVGIVVALAGFEAEEGDMIECQNGYAEYDGEEWFGDLETFEPGQGYIYYSNGSASKTLVYQTGVSKINRVVTNNIMSPKIENRR